MFNNFFQQVIPFIRWSGKMWHSQTCHIWQYYNEHALCMLDN